LCRFLPIGKRNRGNISGEIFLLIDSIPLPQDLNPTEKVEARKTFFLLKKTAQYKWRMVYKICKGSIFVNPGSTEDIIFESLIT
jgi:hypothetical protein